MPWIKYIIALCSFLLLACPDLPEEIYDNPLDPNLPGFNTPALVFFPDSVSVNLGFSVSVDIHVKNVPNLSGAFIEISYDINRLSLLSYTQGDHFQNAEGTMFFLDDDTENGIIQINTAYLGDITDNVNGTGKLATLNFTTTLPGQSLLLFTSNCELLNPDDEPIQIAGFGVGVVYVE